jgi:hypothetical protein
MGNPLLTNRIARDAAPVVGSYICDDPEASCCPDRPGSSGGAHHGWGCSPHCWHESTRRRLEWQYGENRVDAADLAQWNGLGARKAVAA